MSHPDIKLGKKTEEEILAEFIDTFEMHYGIIVSRQSKLIASRIEIKACDIE